jgi:hypothetical protein
MADDESMDMLFGSRSQGNARRSEAMTSAMDRVWFWTTKRCKRARLIGPDRTEQDVTGRVTCR